MQIAIRDLLFINYEVPVERVRSLVPEQFELDTRTGAGGDARAFVSVVPFTIAEVLSSAWPLGRVSFNQINYRVYVASEEGPAVYFLDLKVGSRALATSASFLGLPVNYGSINLATSPLTGEPGSRLYSVESEGREGLMAQVTFDGSAVQQGDPDVPSEFITERSLGFITASSGSMYRIVVNHPPLKTVQARVTSIRVPLLESLGVIDVNQSNSPHSVLYVEEALFEADMPTRQK
jgi:uncharacterized protein YqjF (DUF2071 family)